MCSFVNTEEFRNLEVAFALDEGAPLNEDKFMVYNNERITYRKFDNLEAKLVGCILKETDSG